MDSNIIEQLLSRLINYLILIKKELCEQNYCNNLLRIEKWTRIRFTSFHFIIKLLAAIPTEVVSF